MEDLGSHLLLVVSTRWQHRQHRVTHHIDLFSSYFGAGSNAFIWRWIYWAGWCCRWQTMPTRSCQLRSITIRMLCNWPCSFNHHLCRLNKERKQVWINPRDRSVMILLINFFFQGTSSSSLHTRPAKIKCWILCQKSIDHLMIQWQLDKIDSCKLATTLTSD